MVGFVYKICRMHRNCSQVSHHAVRNTLQFKKTNLQRAVEVSVSTRKLSARSVVQCCAVLFMHRRGSADRESKGQGDDGLFLSTVQFSSMQTISSQQS